MRWWFWGWAHRPFRHFRPRVPPARELPRCSAEHGTGRFEGGSQLNRMLGALNVASAATYADQKGDSWASRKGPSELPFLAKRKDLYRKGAVSTLRRQSLFGGVGSHRLLRVACCVTPRVGFSRRHLLNESLFHAVCQVVCFFFLPSACSTVFA